MADPITWFHSLPPITKTWLGLSFAVTAAVTLDVMQPADVLFRWDRIYDHVELWRILTSFCYLGGPLHEPSMLLMLYFMYLHAKQYEGNPYPAGGGGRTSDCAFAFLFCMVHILVSFPLINHYGQEILRLWMGHDHHHHHGVLLLPYFTRTLEYAILYLWARRNPRANVQLIVVPIQGQYLPWATIGLSLLLGGRINETIHGFVVGHAYYYWMDVLPTLLNGRLVLRTPQILSDWCGDAPQRRLLQQEQQRQAQVVRENRNVTQQQQQRQRQEDDERLFREEGATAAHIAAKLGNLPALERLAQTNQGRTTMFDAADHNGWRPLHEAVRGGHLPVIDFLVVQQQVDINVRTGGQNNNNNGPSPLWFAEESFHGPHHAVTRRLRQLGAVKIGPGEPEQTENNPQ